MRSGRRLANPFRPAHRRGVQGGTATRTHHQESRGRATLQRPRPAPPDAELVSRMARGDVDAHRMLYERHAASILRYLVSRLGGDRGLAEEALHDVMIEAMRAAASYGATGSVRSWLYGIAHHRACNTLRSRRREIVIADPDPGAHRANGTGGAGRGRERGGAGGIDAAIDLEAALAALPDEQRAALELVLLHGLSVEESARALGVAPGTIKSRVFRAKRALRDLLAPEVDHAM